MRILLDECLPRRLANEFPSHNVSTVAEQGWSGTKNGKLLKLAEKDFEVFITVDQNLEHQQNLTVAGIAVIVLLSESSRFDALLPIVPAIENILTANPQPGMDLKGSN